MAFFCPGSGPKIRKEAESKQRSHTHSEWQHQSFPHHSYNTRNGIQPHSRSVTDKVQDVSRSQPQVGNQFLKKLLVRCDHTPDSPNELAVKKGEMVELIKRDKEWLFVRNDRGKEGYVPNNKCFTPIGPRPRLNSVSGAKGAHQVSTENHSPNRPNRVIPLYSSSSAGRIQRHNSPLPDPEQEKVAIKRARSPHMSSNGGILLSQEGAPVTLDPKYSPSSSSGVASMSDPHSPAMMRAYSQDELKPRRDDDSMCSLSQSAADPLAPPPIDNFKKLDGNARGNGHRKQSSSDDSGTVDVKETDCASTVRTDSSSEDGSSVKPGKGSSRTSRSNTPSYRDRPLPSPPKELGSSEEKPPPPPPRHSSLDRNRQTPRINSGDMDPYASPIDSIINGSDSPTSILSEQTKVRRDVQCKDAGIHSPYSEVYRPKNNRRPINQDTEYSPQHPRRSSFHRNHSPVSAPKSMERRNSPLVNEDQRQLNYVANEAPAEATRSLMKFRKTRWGVYLCTEEFEAVDENEVSVAEGEQVVVFNQDDSQWYWVVKHKTDNSEGFVPSYILKEVTLGTPTRKHSAGLSDVHVARTPGPITHTPSLPSVQPRARNYSTSNVTRTPNHRSRVNSTGSTHIHKVNASSIERIPQDASNFSPSSPPPPYTVLDPAPLSTAIRLSQGSDKEVPVTPTVMTRTHSHNLSRNRPPTFPSARGRVSVPQFLALQPPMMGHVSRSSSHLPSPVETSYREHPTYPTTPMATTAVGGTLV